MVFFDQRGVRNRAATDIRRSIFLANPLAALETRRRGGRMAIAADFIRLAGALPGVVEYRHFDRRAFKARVTFATLSADGLTANLKLTPDQQALKCSVAPEAFEPLPNAWGARGWTLAKLASLGEVELAAALGMARRVAEPKAKRSRKRRDPDEIAGQLPDFTQRRRERL
jgi:hypothetical protein